MAQRLDVLLHFQFQGFQHRFLFAWDLAQVLAGQYHKVIEHNRETFERLGIIGPPDQDGNFMISTKRMNALMLGAIGQLWQRMKLLEAGDGV